MPSNNEDRRPLARGRRAAYSVVEVARLCRLSRARFYDLIQSRVMPPPVYAIGTRRPLYTAELAAWAVEVRETNIGIDGRYVLFQERRAVPPPTAAAPVATATTRRQPAIDPITQEMIESLRSMGVTCPQDQIVEAIRRRCPQGLTEAAFERELLGLYGDLRRPTSASKASTGCLGAA
jgi:predicted DNA-binding transcriptional regulator AlpA